MTNCVLACTDWLMGNCLPLIHRQQSGEWSGEEDEHVISGNDEQPLAARRRRSSAAQSTPANAAAAAPVAAHNQTASSSRVSTTSSTGSVNAAQQQQEAVSNARRQALIRQLPTDTFVEGGKGDQECIICMVELEAGERVRYLPCMHSYHVGCIDDWLQRKFSCPSCMEPVEVGLLSSYTAAESTLDQLMSTSAGPSRPSPPQLQQQHDKHA